MFSQIKLTTLLVGACLLAACSSSPTEETFGDSVRNVIAQQSIGGTGTLQPDEPIQHGDGRRLENVTTVYQGNVGNPATVVNEIQVQSRDEG